MGNILGFVGTIAAAGIQSATAKAIADKQARAIREQRDWVYTQLDPNKIANLAQLQDFKNATDRLEQQGKLDPDLLKARRVAEKKILQQAETLGVESGKVSAQATKEALAGGDVASQGKQQLIDAALAELRAGASLPPDLQAELVKAGLEKSGMVTGAATPKGIGGQITRQLLGSAGLQLKERRQQQAANLLGSAQGLESQRAQILGTLFPNLATTQLNTLAGEQGVLAQSNSLMSPAGLSGGDIANLWLSRVGATNQLNTAANNAVLAGQMGSAAAWQRGMGSAIPYAASTVPNYQFGSKGNTSGYTAAGEGYGSYNSGGGDGGAGEGAGGSGEDADF